MSVAGQPSPRPLTKAKSPALAPRKGESTRPGSPAAPGRLSLLGEIAGLLGNGLPGRKALQHVVESTAQGTSSDLAELRTLVDGQTMVFRAGESAPAHSRRLSVRLRVSGTPLGELAVCRERPYQEADRLFLETVASHLGTALEAARVQAIQPKTATGEATSWARVCSLIGGVLKRAAPPEPPAAVPDERRLSALTDDLVTLARVETQEGLPAGRISVSTWLGGLVAGRRERAEAAGRVLLLADPGPDLCVNGVPEHLVSAVDHLIANALAYSPAGSAVTVSAVRKDDEIMVCVDDDGPGIPGAERDRVYERFYRGRAALLMDIPGNGLGLAIVSEVAAAHGGRTHFCASPTGGTRFVLALPAA